jgi:hypothetical protein
MAGVRKNRTEPNYPASAYDNTAGAPGPTATTGPPVSPADKARAAATRATTAEMRGKQRSA